MPRRCSVCQHADRTIIESDLIGGAPYRDIAKRYRLSTASVHRHRESHLPKRLTQAKRVDELAHADVLLERLAFLERRARTLTDKAESGGELRTALAGVREQSRLVELAARIHTERSLSIDETRQLVQDVVAATKRHVTDKETLRAIGMDLRQRYENSTNGLIGGRSRL